MAHIDTDNYSKQLRAQSLRKEGQRILIARLAGSEQEKDLTEPVNCNGFGRIRHFRRKQFSDWTENPLPIFPIAAGLGMPVEQELRVQVFQNSACNWRCWYCYVDFNRLAGSEEYGKFFSADELVSMYAGESNRPPAIDLSGGQPDLTPEWVLWMMRAVDARGLKGKVFLWSDDNLSNYYFWEHLSQEERVFIATFPCYARVGCFKGYTPESFTFNTTADPTLFDRQFDVFRRLNAEGIDLYAYVTFTGPPDQAVDSNVAAFVDRLQAIHEHLPLRVVPLRVVETFHPVTARLKSVHHDATVNQLVVHAAWRRELERRFPTKLLEAPIQTVSIRTT